MCIQFEILLPLSHFVNISYLINILQPIFHKISAWFYIKDLFLMPVGQEIVVQQEYSHSTFGNNNLYYTGFCDFKEIINNR